MPRRRLHSLYFFFFFLFPPAHPLSPLSAPERMFRFRERIAEELVVKRFTTVGHCSWSWLTVRLSCFRGIIENATLENEEVGPHGRRYPVKNCPELPVANRRSLAPRPQFVAHGALIRVYFLFALTRPTADEDIVSDSVSCIFLDRDYHHYIDISR